MSQHESNLSQSSSQGMNSSTNTYATQPRARNRRPDMQLYVPRAKRLQQNLQGLSHVGGDESQDAKRTTQEDKMKLSKKNEIPVVDSLFTNSIMESTSCAFNQYNRKIQDNKVSSGKDLPYNTEHVKIKQSLTKLDHSDESLKCSVAAGVKALVKGTCDSSICIEENTNSQLSISERPDPLYQQAQCTLHSSFLNDSVREVNGQEMELQKSLVTVVSPHCNTDDCLNYISHENNIVYSSICNNLLIEEKDKSNFEDSALSFKTNSELHIAFDVNKSVDNSSIQTVQPALRISDNAVPLSKSLCCEINSNDSKEINFTKAEEQILDSSDEKFTIFVVPNKIADDNTILTKLNECSSVPLHTNNSKAEPFQTNVHINLEDERSINSNMLDKCNSSLINSGSFLMCEMDLCVDEHSGQTHELSLAERLKSEMTDRNLLQNSATQSAEESTVDEKVTSCSMLDFSQEQHLEDDSWDTIFDDDGECLKPDIMKEISSNLGSIKIERAKCDYKDFQMYDADVTGEEFSHIIEIFGFSPEFKTNDLVTSFSVFKGQGFDIKWVDDTHALGVFSSPLAASEALALQYPLVKVRPLSQGIKESKLKAKKCAEFLQPYRPRPETSATLARRLVSGALGLKVQIPKEQRELERQKLKEAKERRRQAAKQSRDIWDGVVS